MSTATLPMYEWKSIPWPKLQRNVFKLQKRIYQSSQRGDIRTVHQLQRLLLSSQSARMLATRRVTQDNWLASLGLELKPEKTHVTHTLDGDMPSPGFNFLGFHIRQHQVGRTHSGLCPGRIDRLGFKTIITPSREGIARHKKRLSETQRSHRGGNSRFFYYPFFSRKSNRQISLFFLQAAWYNQSDTSSPKRF